MENIQIEKMKKSEVIEVTNLLAQAFAENPFTKAIWDIPGKEMLKQSALMYRYGMIERKVSNVFVARLNGQMVGAINYIFWPDCQPRLLELTGMVFHMVISLGKTIPRLIKITSAWEKEDPKTPHSHIGPIGVLPEFKGKGIGSQMLDYCLKMADNAGIPSYLETDAPRSVGLYERHGFSVTKEIFVGTFKSWLMWRDAK